MKFDPDEYGRSVLKEAERVSSKRKPAHDKRNGRAKSEQSDTIDDARPPAFSDEALALRFADRHADDLRYVDDWSRWLVWDGHRWRVDHTRHAFDQARLICRQASIETNKPKISIACASAKTVAAVVSLGRSDRRVAATVDQWDSDLQLLNTTDGVIDLRDGSARPHRPGDHLTKMTAVSPGGACPRWRAFLDKVTAGDTTLQEFLQRMCGYALTGSTREHALFFLHGTGANGKSVFITTIAGILGDYHCTAPIEAFTASNSDRHPTDLAMLRGARLVTAVETEEGRRWAESKIKTLTGGDRISARFMRQDFFEYTPQFKLLIAGNHKPGLRSVDEAIRRRFHLIPFTVTIPPDERDRDLTEKLKAEWPGILAWMIDGCADWQERGLVAPEAVTAATVAYLDAQDAIASWIDDQCERDPNAWERSQTLFANWKAWAERSGEAVGDTKTFRDRLEVRGIHHKREPGTGQRGYQGVRIKPQEAADNAEPYWKR